MKKRILSMMLALVLLVGLLPVKAEAADSVSYVEHQIRAYADSIDQSDADSTAAKLLASHGMTKNGKKLTMDEDDALTAALLNSEMMQVGLASIFVEAIDSMQSLDMQSVPGIKMNFRWNGSENVYQGYMKANTGCGADSLDWIFCYERYRGNLNSYDSAMEWMVSDCNADVVITCTRDSGTEKTYHVTMDISDRFDFSTANTSGFKLLMSGLGMLMFEEFDWSCQVEFDLTIPYSYDQCSHTSGAYHWTLDNENHILTTDNSEPYTLNNGTHKSFAAVDGTTHHYYELDHTVRLLHNKPWILEYDVSQPRSISFEPVESAVTKNYPQIKQDSIYSLYVVSKDYVMHANPDIGGSLDRFYAYNYYGTQLKSLFTYNYTTLYTIRLENEVFSDGSNMVYLSVTETESGKLCLDKIPMDDHSYYGGWMEKSELRDNENDWLSGKDIFINYFGSEVYGFAAAYLDIRIWENGLDATDESYMEHRESQPTCTESGGVTHTCSRCGYTYTDSITDALGHSFDDYSFNNNATCTADGTQTRKCTVCGEKETVTASGTALGHDYNAAVTEPTLTEQGYTTYTCTRCGDGYKDDYTDKKEHKYVPEVTEPTCIAEGFTTYTCSECGDSYVDDYTDMVEHTPVIDPAAAPTCVEKGKTEGSHCGVCGYVIKKQANISTVDRHNYTEEITKIPTYDEAGEVTYTCKDCGKTEVKVVPPFEKPTPNNPFTDVAETDWFYEPVLWALKEDVTKGKTETTFAPNEGCTRAQVVTFLWAANGKPEPKSMDNPFDDVASDAWYLKPVLWAVEQGITTGISETEFGPEQTCTRAQIATFLWAANGRQAVTSESTFVDVAGSEWYATPVIWAAENEVTGGIGEGKFGPEQTCTRAQVVTFLYKVYG